MRHPASTAAVDGAPRGGGRAAAGKRQQLSKCTAPLLVVSTRIYLYVAHSCKPGRCALAVGNHFSSLSRRRALRSLLQSKHALLNRISWMPHFAVRRAGAGHCNCPPFRAVGAYKACSWCGTPGRSHGSQRRCVGCCPPALGGAACCRHRQLAAPGPAAASSPLHHPHPATTCSPLPTHRK